VGDATLVRAAALVLAVWMVTAPSSSVLAWSGPDVPECQSPEAQSPTGPSRALTPGSPSASVIVCARPKWTDTRIAVEAGQVYRLSASGTWHDDSIPSGADGYSSDTSRLSWAQQVLFRLAERWRRAPEAPWFALVCAVNEAEATMFTVARTPEWRAPASGTLRCFANDLSFKYDNNSGFVRLSVERGP
jgi:hypothetical protein